MHALAGVGEGEGELAQGIALGAVGLAPELYQVAAPDQGGAQSRDQLAHCALAPAIGQQHQATPALLARVPVAAGGTAWDETTAGVAHRQPDVHVPTHARAGAARQHAVQGVAAGQALGGQGPRAGQAVLVAPPAVSARVGVIGCRAGRRAVVVAVQVRGVEVGVGGRAGVVGHPQVVHS